MPFWVPAEGMSQSLNPEVQPGTTEMLHVHAKAARSVHVVQSDHFRVGTSVI